jgi:alpha-L-glutamate ligase-like protein
VGLARKLFEAGVLGMNMRNGDFLSKYNPRKLYPLVDDKLKTKRLAQAAGISVPELYHVIEAPHEVKKLSTLLAPYEDFALKPANGSGGEGIIIISGRSKNNYKKINGSLISEAELAHHILNILNGMYSLGGHPDQALIEYRVRFDPVFERISYAGVPDIRIIVFLGVPVMAMIRLPTRSSDGKANLHQGAIGCGIDISTGTTLSAVYRDHIVNEHPDTGEMVSGVAIPHWERLLELASGCYELTGLGYQGVDIVLDRDHGPLILELNARPGLNIQIANRRGLLPALRLVEREASQLSNTADRISFARQHFKVL